MVEERKIEREERKEEEDKGREAKKEKASLRKNWVLTFKFTALIR